GGGRRRRVGAHRRPVVLGEDERGEVDLTRELDEALDGRRAGIEGRRPGIDVRDVLEAARQRLEQLRLLARRAEKDARFVHPLSRTARLSVSAAPRIEDADSAPGLRETSYRLYLIGDHET